MEGVCVLRRGGEREVREWRVYIEGKWRGMEVHFQHVSEAHVLDIWKLEREL